ncbi:uncharacterized protein MONOS_11075 [Monocercomonoides exilis]|uniref:uncharacterized protein n=1 Tax=Monocercomonoides exilis TaxID=2049356 RepID=UPI00355991E9|nr:hypothetical protein MONOS_11075 [Monocercomonoides exilis]|eukprot:MONOS_11075.1-p1 / transcript=MONOS_11075.1 / gene=MONOS_11075 / organism=Monocercomonoides_exilis_PA203 / gene_product=unspecified product / transcript_product=unspecified product / location=Mono_scaffold00535:9176-10291(-) / protein_length=256 / sequence_SO=supercontig / SO=protein_coding / is_pseudo=false
MSRWGELGGRGRAAHDACGADGICGEMMRCVGEFQGGRIVLVGSFAAAVSVVEKESQFNFTVTGTVQFSLLEIVLGVGEVVGCTVTDVSYGIEMFVFLREEEKEKEAAVEEMLNDVKIVKRVKGRRNEVWGMGGGEVIVRVWKERQEVWAAKRELRELRQEKRKRDERERKRREEEEAEAMWEEWAADAEERAQREREELEEMRRREEEAEVEAEAEAETEAEEKEAEERRMEEEEEEERKKKEKEKEKENEKDN